MPFSPEFERFDHQKCGIHNTLVLHPAEPYCIYCTSLTHRRPACPYAKACPNCNSTAHPVKRCPIQRVPTNQYSSSRKVQPRTSNANDYPELPQKENEFQLVHSKTYPRQNNKTKTKTSTEQAKPQQLNYNPFAVLDNEDEEETDVNQVETSSRVGVEYNHVSEDTNNTALNDEDYNTATEGNQTPIEQLTPTPSKKRGLDADELAAKLNTLKTTNIMQS